MVWGACSWPRRQSSVERFGVVVGSRLSAGWIAVFAAMIGAAASFVLVTVAMDTLSDPLVVFVSSLTALLIVAVAQGGQGLAALRGVHRDALLLAVLGGALAFGAAPLLALSQRATDAPSGSDSLFLTTSAWGLACVVGALFSRAERPPVTPGTPTVPDYLAGMLLAQEREKLNPRRAVG